VSYFIYSRFLLSKKPFAQKFPVFASNLSLIDEYFWLYFDLLLACF
jgi:hypothetical protein